MTRPSSPNDRAHVVKRDSIMVHRWPGVTRRGNPPRHMGFEERFEERFEGGFEGKSSVKAGAENVKLLIVAFPRSLSDQAGFIDGYRRFKNAS
ncbi:MAG TPA: hypothetical protein VME47_13735 [Acetobacteraceae bacterium]|nr:hypothetical protein [Acetobacteraceae bacterium]